MTMATYKPANSLPMVWYPGLKDNSTRAVPYEAPVLPIHTPLFFGFAAKGQTKAQFVNGGTAMEHYGSEMFDMRSEYATLVTPFLRMLNEYSNPFLFQRLRPVDAAPEASVCLALEIVETDKMIEYERTKVGRYKYDNNNKRIPTTSEIKGVVARWRVLPVTGDSKLELGKRRVAEGVSFYKNDQTATSTIYPIFEFAAQWFGKYGNNIGIRLFPLRSGNRNFKINLMRDQRTFMYGIQVVKRQDEKSRAHVVNNLYDAETTVFSFKEGAFNRDAGGLSINFDEVFLDSYRDLSSEGGRPYRYGDVGHAYVYQDNLEEVLKKMYAVERAANGQAVVDYDAGDHHMINFMTGVDHEDRPYRAVEVLGVLTGGDVNMTEGATHWFSGGYDGKMGNKVLDELVRHEILNFGKGESKYLDQGEFPFRQVYDIGYHRETKLAMASLLMRRQDINVTLSTCDFITDTVGPNLQDEGSIGAQLTATLRGIPESEEFGTPAYRGVVVPGCGKLVKIPNYRRFVPNTIEVLKWRALYMGGAAGMKPGYGYDAPPYNHITELKELTNTYADVSIWSRNWDNGMTHFRHKTDKLLFCPGLKTVYKDDTSVLTSDITMQATCDINGFLFTLWTNITGNSKMSDQELIEYSNNSLLEFVRGRYDGRFIIEPNTHFTREDQAKGYSWTCEVNMYANPMRTQSKSYIVSHRIGG